MAVKLVEVSRGGITESISRGDVAVVDAEGRVEHFAGNVGKYTYLRSAAKPLQAMQVILSGAYSYYGFSHKELAVMCASHYGEPMHRETVAGILDKIGLRPEDILAGTVTSLNPDYALKLAGEGVELNPLFSDCSGKHAGMLAICRYKGYPLDGYTSPDHPLQRELLHLIASICQYPESDVGIGIDGCSVPVHAMPLAHMARAYARITSPGNLSGGMESAARGIFEAMNRHPYMVSGTGGFCTELIKNTHGKLIGKVGAEGVYCIGIKNKNTGIAVKMEDGNMKRLPPVVVHVLKKLGLLSRQEYEALGAYHVMSNLNDVHWKVGEIRPVFHLREVKAADH